jgi:hypothetical protein
MKKYAYILILVLFIAGVVWLIETPGKSGMLDAFATCITDSGAKFYGAFWCPHCAAQKARFGNSAKLLPYIECSNPDGQSQNATCNNLGITTYPTWYFASSTAPGGYEVVTGEQELADLSARTSCPLPSTD